MNTRRAFTKTRRVFIKTAATTAGVLMSGLPSGWVGGVYADDGPETKTIRFGIIALTDCAPIVMAHELGLLQEVRHRIHRLEGSVLGGHQGQAVAR